MLSESKSSSHRNMEYAKFLLIEAGRSPKVCPKCGSTSFTTLWLAKPLNRTTQSTGRCGRNGISGATTVFPASVVLWRLGGFREQRPTSFMATRKRWLAPHLPSAEQAKAGPMLSHDRFLLDDSHRCRIEELSLGT